MKLKRRAIVLLTTMAVVLVAGSGVALAATAINCTANTICVGTPNPDVVSGSDLRDYMFGKGGEDTCTVTVIKTPCRETRVPTISTGTQEPTNLCGAVPTMKVPTPTPTIAMTTSMAVAGTTSSSAAFHRGESIASTVS